MHYVFLDTQILIYAFEQGQEQSISLIDRLLDSGEGRLVLSEENLYEFSQSGTLAAALNLTSKALQYNPIWIRSFAEIQVEELTNFLRFSPAKNSIPATHALTETFDECSILAGKKQLDPIAFVTAANDPRAQAGISQIHSEHAAKLTELTGMIHAGMLTKVKAEQAFRNKIITLLRRDKSPTLQVADMDVASAVKYCEKHRKWLMRECPSIAVDQHLSDYRTANPNRIARLGDSKDLTMSIAAFPYTNIFVTNDGYLHNGLAYVKKKFPRLQTDLVRL